MQNFHWFTAQVFDFMQVFFSLQDILFFSFYP